MILNEDLIASIFLFLVGLKMGLVYSHHIVSSIMIIVANHRTTYTEALTIRVKYHVVTYDENLVLNNPKYFSDISNDITATVGDGSFKFEPGKQYKIVMVLGLTSAKFEVYELDEQDEWILLSATVKNWDVKTIEADVK